MEHAYLSLHTSVYLYLSHIYLYFYNGPTSALSSMTCCPSSRACQPKINHKGHTVWSGTTSIGFKW